MRNHLSFRLLLGILLTLNLLSAKAQSQQVNDRTYSMRIANLTSEERDAIVSDLSNGSDARVVFACVPAGIMVFETAPAKDRIQARQATVARIEARTRRERLNDGPASLAEAEAACANARNQ